MSQVATEMQAEQKTQEQAISQYREIYLAPYSPQRGVVQEFANRLRGSLGYKGAADLTWPELLTLAHASLATGLNPYIGEIWAIHEYGLMVGRMGWVKKLGELGEKQSFKSWSQYSLLQHHQYPEYSIPDDAQIAFVCEIRRSDWLKIYNETLKDLSQSMKLDYQLIIDLLGKPPVARGVGYIRANEDFKKSAMPLSERAKKRAFAQACREFVYLPFDTLAEGDMVNGQTIDEPNIVEGNYKVTGEPPKDSPEDPEHAPSRPNGYVRVNGHEIPIINGKAVQSADDMERPMEPEILRDYVRTFGQALLPGNQITDKQHKIISGLLKGLFKGSATAEKDGQAYLEFVAAASDVDGISKATASVLIDLIKSPDPDDWSPSDVARKEAERVLHEVYKDEGQLDLFEQQEAEEAAEAEEHKIEQENLIGEPAPERKTELPAAEKTSVKAQAATPIAGGKIAVPEIKSEDKKAPGGKKYFKPVSSSYKKVEPKPAEPAEDNGEDINILALKRSRPTSWLTAVEMLNKTLGTEFTAGGIREAAAKKQGKKDFEALSPESGWQTAIEVAQEEAARIAAASK